jgi:predicted  nucleic acid-binding Zn-ribbon protein
MQALTSITKKLLYILIVVGISAVIIIYLTPKACSKTMTFALGPIDPQFNISRSMVMSNLQDVTDMWNSAHPQHMILKQIDTSATADVTISFIYDERQRTTIKNERLKRQIQEQKDELSSLKQTITVTQAEYDKKNEQIQNETADYIKKLNVYKDKVDGWNVKGGAPKAAYDELKQEQILLEVQRINLNSEIQDLNNMATAIKNFSGKHNAVVDQVNQNVDAVNQTSNKEFEEGLYNPNTKSIIIYEFQSPLSLKRVLAHELGHALGLDHVEGKDSIMYAYNDSDVFELSKQDKDALDVLCEQRNLILMK